MNKNSKVPMAILSCFLIAFIIQGILKLCGVFVFEKVLDWDIFNVIDDTLWLNIVFNSFITCISTYCLSFSLTTRPYSNKWYHYIIIVLSSTGIVALKLLLYPSISIQIILDIYLYIIVPFIINITTDTKYKVISKVYTLICQILLYFCYLGICYWSSTLNSLLPITQIYTGSMQIFLIYFEVYIGLISLMLTTNILLSKIKGENNMHFPINIANDIAKKKAKKQKIDAKILKLNEKSNQLAKEIAELENDEDKK